MTITVDSENNCGIESFLIQLPVTQRLQVGKTVEETIKDRKGKGGRQKTRRDSKKSSVIQIYTENDFFQLLS